MIYHYYHIYADGDWQRVVSEHFDTLYTSDLINNCQLQVGIVGNESNRKNVIRYIQSRINRQWFICAESDAGWEQTTLDVMAIDVYNGLYLEDSLIFYAHTKGAAFTGEHPDWWRKVMTQELVGNWRTIRERMSTGLYDTAGCFLIEEDLYEDGVPVFAGVRGGSTVLARLLEEAGLPPLKHAMDFNEPQPTQKRLHYSGNFWCATVDWVRGLEYPCKNNNRWDAEFWLGSSRDGAVPRALDVHPGNPFDELKKGL